MMGWGVGMGAGWLLMLLFWVFVVAAAVWLALTLAGRSMTERPRQSDALHILEERLARGEIDTEEFRARKAALEETRR